MAEETNNYLNSEDRNGSLFGELGYLTYQTTSDAIKTMYNKWSPSYDKESAEKGYVGAIYMAKQVFDVCQEQNHPTSARIIDLGAGTGMLAKLLRQYELLNIDALDISAKMLKVAEDQGLYKNYFCEGLGIGRLPIDDNTYDMATATACFGRGHIGSSGLDEAVRIVKRGGFIIWSLRLDYYTDQASGFAAKVEDFIERKIWVVHERKQIDYYLNVPESHGLRYCFLFVCRKL